MTAARRQKKKAVVQAAYCHARSGGFEFDRLPLKQTEEKQNCRKAGSSYHELKRKHSIGGKNTGSGSLPENAEGPHTDMGRIGYTIEYLSGVAANVSDGGGIAGLPSLTGVSPSASFALLCGLCPVSFFPIISGNGSTRHP